MGHYKLGDENVVHQFFPTQEEFVALADMFRNDGPIKVQWQLPPSGIPRRIGIVDPKR